MTRSKRFLTLALVAAPLCFLGCGSSTSTTAGATGGASGHGGASGNGGSSGHGGSSGSGGSSSSGGASGSGGSSSSGGTSGSGGASGNGGSSGTGGTSGTSCAIPTPNVTAANYPNGLTLTKACSPYLVDDIYVQDGGVLTIEAGATLKFSDNTTIFVGQSGTGKLVAKGTAQAQITLTSQYDPPSAGDWYGIEFSQGTDTASQISYTAIDYAGGNGDAAIAGESGMPTKAATIDHVAINNSAAGGILVTDTGSFTVTNCTMDGQPYTP